MYADISTGPDWELKAVYQHSHSTHNDEFNLRFIVKDCKDANSFILAAVKTVCDVCHDSIAHAFISARSVFTAL